MSTLVDTAAVDAAVVELGVVAVVEETSLGEKRNPCRILELELELELEFDFVLLGVEDDDDEDEGFGRQACCQALSY